MTGTDLITGVTILGAIFGPLSLIAYVVKKTAIERRKRRARVAARLATYRSIRVLSDRPEQRPVAPRVLYVPKREEPEHEADVIIPSVWIGWDRGETDRTVVHPFEGKGGQSGGAGASGDWEAPASENPEPVAETESSPDPEPAAEVQES